jgi:hypothetical protein
LSWESFTFSFLNPFWKYIPDGCYDFNYNKIPFDDYTIWNAQSLYHSLYFVGQNIFSKFLLYFQKKEHWDFYAKVQCHRARIEKFQNSRTNQEKNKWFLKNEKI